MGRPGWHRKQLFRVCVEKGQGKSLNRTKNLRLYALLLCSLTPSSLPYSAHFPSPTESVACATLRGWGASECRAGGRKTPTCTPTPAPLPLIHRPPVLPTTHRPSHRLPCSLQGTHMCTHTLMFLHTHAFTHSHTTISKSNNQVRVTGYLLGSSSWNLENLALVLEIELPEILHRGINNTEP